MLGRLSIGSLVLAAPGIALLLAAGLALVAPLAVAASVRVTVKPRTGGATKRFAVSFRAPDPAAVDGTLVREYTVSAQRRRGSGCTSSVSSVVFRAAAGRTVRVGLSPVHGGQTRWCEGVFHGQVAELSRPVCAGPRGAATVVCPLAITEKRLGRFTFRVR